MENADPLSFLDAGDDIAAEAESVTAEVAALEPAPEPAAAAPEPAPEPRAAAPAPEPAAQKTVPLASLMEERNQWKRENEALQARLRALEEKPAAPAPAPEPAKPEPEWVEDPKAYVDSKVDSALAKLEAAKSLTTEQQSQLQELRLANAVKVAEAAAPPDWQDALNHLRQMRYQEIKLVYTDAPDDQILGAIQNEERQVAIQQFGLGKNPYDYAYQLAKLRGYTPRATPAPQSQPAPGSVRPPAQAPGPKTLSADMTLDSMSGTAPGEQDADADEDIGELINQARTEVFGRRRA